MSRFGKMRVDDKSQRLAGTRNLVRMLPPFNRCCKPSLFSIFQLSLGFYLILTAFQSCSVIQQSVLHYLSSQNGTAGALDYYAGYNSLAIIYGVLTVCNLFASPIVLLLTAKWSMVVGAITNVLYLASFLYVRNEVLYTASAVLGFGSSLLWVGQGNYITLVSNRANVGRNGAIVWAIFQFSLPTGGLFLYSQFLRGGGDIDPSSVRTIFIAFTCMSALGAVNFMLLKPLKSGDVSDSLLECAGEQESPSVDSVAVTSVRARISVFDETRNTLKLLGSSKMLLLCIVFLYSGMLLTFWSGVYGTCISFTSQFATPTKLLLAWNVVFVGLGETSGAFVVSLLSRKIEGFGRPPVVIFGASVNVIAFFLIFLMLPSESPMIPTEKLSYILPSDYLALLCSVLLGFGDSCWNTQIYATLGKQYAGESTQAFSLFKFVQSLAAAVTFSYSSHVLLHWQLALLTVLCFAASLAYTKVENFGVEMDVHAKPI
uniref:UNC93-like protein MFSD11 n=1 Tax=Trichuris muris TaxID=70415 RepID=A0A5S6QJ68_TRIMR